MGLLAKIFGPLLHTLEYYLGLVVMVLFSGILRRVSSKNPVKRWLLAQVYNWLARRGLEGAEGYQGFRCMNYGHAKSPPPEHRPVDVFDKREYTSFCLYYFTASSGHELSLEGKRVLEIGSGRGGGAQYLASVTKPAMYLAVEISPPAVQFARRASQKISNCFFTQGSAEDIPAPDRSFDIVVNVESSHCYMNPDKFLSECHRVLVDGGVLCITDFRFTNAGLMTLASWEELLKKVKGFTLEKEIDVSNDVAKAIDESNEDVVKGLIQRTPQWAQAAMHNFAGTTKSAIYIGIKEGWCKYVHYRLRKTGASFSA